MSVKEVKKEVKSQNFYLSIFNQIREGKRPAQIKKELNISKQNLQYYINKLKKEGYISKKGYGVWEVNKEVKTFSLGTKPEKPTTNLHALQINFPILDGKILDDDWEVKEKLRNWLPKYKGLDTLGGLTLKNNNNKSLTIFAKSRDIFTLEEIDILAFKIRSFAFEFFKNKHGVILDVINAEVKNLNIATEDKHSKGMIRKGEKFELDLSKKAEKILQKDKIDAKAWIDGSPFSFTAETNDKEWKRAYLNMPFAVSGLSNSMPAIAEYNKNILLHMKVQEEQLKTQKAMQGMLAKLSKLIEGKQ